MNKLLIAGAALLLTGCAASPTDAQRCTGYGFAPETQGFAQCVQTESIARRQSQDAAMASISATNAATAWKPPTHSTVNVLPPPTPLITNRLQRAGY